jgi:hypothetical protein
MQVLQLRAGVGCPKLEAVAHKAGIVKPNCTNKLKDTTQIFTIHQTITWVNWQKEQVLRQQHKMYFSIQQDEAWKFTFLWGSPHAWTHIHSRMGKQDQLILNHISAARLSKSIPERLGLPWGRFTQRDRSKWRSPGSSITRPFPKVPCLTAQSKLAPKPLNIKRSQCPFHKLACSPMDS